MVNLNFSRQLKLRIAVRDVSLFCSPYRCFVQMPEGSKYPNPNDYLTDDPMRIVVVRSSKPGCEPKCAEWNSAEGAIVLATAEQLRKVINSLNGRKFAKSYSFVRRWIDDMARLMGFLIRARGTDVAVAKTVFDPCESTPAGCKHGTWSGPSGEPDRNRFSVTPLARLCSQVASAVSWARKRWLGSKTTGSTGGGRKMATNLPGSRAGRQTHTTFVAPPWSLGTRRTFESWAFPRILWINWFQRKRHEYSPRPNC